MHIMKFFKTVLRIGLTELQHVSASDIPISKGVCPQQAVRARLQNMSFVI